MNAENGDHWLDVVAGVVKLAVAVFFVVCGVLLAITVFRMLWWAATAGF